MTAISPTSTVARGLITAAGDRRPSAAWWRQRTSPRVPRGSPSFGLLLVFDRLVAPVMSAGTGARLAAGHGFCVEVDGAGGDGGGLLPSPPSPPPHAIASGQDTTSAATSRARRDVRLTGLLPRL